MKTIVEQCQKAAAAFKNLIFLTPSRKEELLLKMAEALHDGIDEVLLANHQDVEIGLKSGMSESLIDRLKLNKEKLFSMVLAIQTIAGYPDPIGTTLESWTQKDGLYIEKVTVPLGVIAMIYEARPNVTVDAVALALKSGNAIVLKGSSSAYRSNLAIVSCFKKVLINTGLDDVVQLLEDTTHEGVITLVKQSDYLDLVIPRGGSQLIKNVVNNATVPSIETGVGNCHIYIDQSAIIDQAINIVVNAKVQRPSVCNAVETVLVHEKIAKDLLPRLLETLKKHDVELRGCEKTSFYHKSVKLAIENDWEQEYLDKIIAIKVVDDVQMAIHHISNYGSKHSEAILSEDQESIALFLKAVDASTVLVNASTRFVDGGEFGFGAEIGISTQKLHARGPMGVKTLVTHKYLVKGSGQIRK